MTINVESTETMYATQEKTFFLKRGEAIRLTPTGSARVNRYNLGTLLDTTTVTTATTFGAYFADMNFRIYCSSGILTVEMGDDSGEPRATTVFPYYHFHGFAGNQTAGDGKFFDLSGINHGVRGANLSDANMFATAGYVSTVDPASGVADSTIHIPNLNFDYASGEKLIVWWMGQGTPEAADTIIMGDGYSTTEGQRGWRLRMKTTGAFDLSLWGASQVSSGSSHATVFDGTLHSLAFAFDGSAKTHGMWCDEVHHTSFGSALSSFGGGASILTTNSNTVNIGASRPAAAASSSVGDGAAIKTRALVIIRLPVSYAMPTVATMTTLFQQLRANPGKLILASAI